MGTEEEVKSMLASHLEKRPTDEVLAELENETGKSKDYWLGYWEGVAYGYKAVLEL